MKLLFPIFITSRIHISQHKKKQIEMYSENIM